MQRRGILCASCVLLAVAGCSEPASAPVDAAPADAPLPDVVEPDASTLPVAQLVAVPVTPNDVVFDPQRHVLHVSVAGRSPSFPNTVATIDPRSGEVTAAVPVNADPGALAISDDAQFLYVGIDSTGSVQRIDLATGALSSPIRLHDPDRLLAGQIAVMPGSPHTFAVSLRIPQVYATPRFAGLVIYDDQVARPDGTERSIHAAQIAFATATTIYGYDSESSLEGLDELAVDARGVHAVRTMSGAGFGFADEFIHDRGLLIGGSGRALDAASLTAAGRFDAQGAVTVDPSGSLVFFAGTSGGDTSGAITLASFDRATFLPRRTVLLPLPQTSAVDPPQEIVKWDADRFALRTGDHLYLVYVPDGM